MFAFVRHADARALAAEMFYHARGSIDVLAATAAMHRSLPPPKALAAAAALWTVPLVGQCQAS